MIIYDSEFLTKNIFWLVFQQEISLDRCMQFNNETETGMNNMCLYGK